LSAFKESVILCMVLANSRMLVSCPDAMLNTLLLRVLSIPAAVASTASET
jgi:hypothetical protein